MKKTLRIALCLGLLGASPSFAADGTYGDGRDGMGTDRDTMGTTTTADRRWGHDTRDDDEEDSDFDRQRFYLGLGPLWVWQNFHESSHRFTGGTGANVDADDSWGAEARLGYRLLPQLALEVQGQYYGESKFDARLPGAVGSSQVGSFEGVGATGNFKVYPIQGRFQPYVLGGLGLMWARVRNDIPGALNDNRTELAGRGGLGMDIYLDKHVAFNVEGSYLQPATSLKDFPVAAITGGVQFHF
jgi:opacity protein-like surface antigen